MGLNRRRFPFCCKLARVYDARPTLRLLLVFGCLGLAAWSATSLELPVWLGVGLAVLPIALAELGAGIAEEAVSRPWRSVASALQILGALTYLGALLGCAVAGEFPTARGALIVLIPTCACGVFAASLILWDRWRLARGQVPAMTDVGEAAVTLHDVEGRNLRALMTVIGGMPLLVGLIAAAFVAALIWIGVKKPESRADPGLWFALLFFSACGLVAVATALERVASIVGGVGAHRWQRRLMLIAMTTFGAALIGIALFGDPAPWMRTLLGVVGALLIAAIPLAQRRMRRGAPLVPTREGIMERHGLAAIVYPWSAVSDLWLGSLSANMALYVRLDLTPHETPQVIGEGTPQRVAKLLGRSERRRRRNRNFTGADLMMLATWSPQPLADLHATLCERVEFPSRCANLPPAAEVVAKPSP